MSPDVRKELLRVLDHYVVGVAGPADLIGVADKLLIDGTYTDSLGELTHLRDRAMCVVGPVFESAIRELRVAVPDKTDAGVRFVREIASRVAANPENSLDDLILIRELPSDIKFAVGAADLGFMSYYLDGSEDLWDDNDNLIEDDEKHMRLAAREALTEAQRWLAAHPEEPQP